MIRHAVWAALELERARMRVGDTLVGRRKENMHAQRVSCVERLLLLREPDSTQSRPLGKRGTGVWSSCERSSS